MGLFDKFVTFGPGPDAEPPVTPTGSPRAAAKPMGVPASTPAAPAPRPVDVRTAMDYTLDEIFREGGAAQGRNSAEIVLKLRDGLATFPVASQLAMLRAMDVADDSWDEASVKADATHRIKVANEYLAMIDQDEATQIAKITALFDDDTKANADRLTALDAQITALRAERERVVAASAAAKATADGRTEAVRVRAKGVRATVAKVVVKYQEIIGFFVN